MHETREEPPETRPTAATSAHPADLLAFEDVYFKNVAKLRKIALRKFHVPAQDVEALIQDVFMSYFLNAHRVNAVESYLVGAICNASRKYWRRSGADEELFCDEVPCAATPGPAIIEEIERKMLLRTLLGPVDGRCRNLFERYYWKGESTQAIAQAIDSTPGSVLVFLHKCRRRVLDAYRAARGNR